MTKNVIEEGSFSRYLEGLHRELPWEALGKGRAEQTPEQEPTDGNPRKTTGLQEANSRTSIFIYLLNFLKNLF